MLFIVSSINGLTNIFDSYAVYILAIFAVTILGLIAQSSVKSTYKKYSCKSSGTSIPAYRVAQDIIQRNGLGVGLTQVSGSLTDHYNPKTEVVGLSQAVYNSDSVAAYAVMAHELGHVMQHRDSYIPIKIRNAILPVAQLGSSAAPYIVIIGLILNSGTLAMIGVYLFAAVFLFQLVTLPVEFNASNRAIELLSEGGYIMRDNTSGAKKVLRAAASTYVVSTLATLVSLLRLLALAKRSNRR